jgi:hypothetical protein
VSSSASPTGFNTGSGGGGGLFGGEGGGAGSPALNGAGSGGGGGSSAFVATAVNTSIQGDTTANPRVVFTYPDPPVLPGGGGGGDFTLGKVKKNKRKGTAKLTVNVTAPGTLDLAGKGIKPASKEALAAGKVKLTIKAKGNKKAKLNDKGKTQVKPEVTYTPTGGTPNTEDKKIKLVKR